MIDSGISGGGKASSMVLLELATGVEGTALLAE